MLSTRLRLGRSRLFFKQVITITTATAIASAAHAGWFDSNPLTPANIRDLSSARNLDFEQAQILTDNDRAFEAKLRVIEKAERTLDLAYFILAQDHSSAHLMAAVLKKALTHPHLKVRILVDYNENYKRLDYLTYLERQYSLAVQARGGTGGLEVRLFNKPTRNIVRDAGFLTMACPQGAKGKECSAAKIAAVDQALNQGLVQIPETNSGLLLSGIYSKSPDTIMGAILRGQQIDVAKFKGGAAMSPEERGQLKELAKLIFKAKFGGLSDKLAASMKLSLAMSMHGDKINPIMEALEQHLPLGIERTAAGKQDWIHLTDFLHHKLIMADGRYFVLGGRNIENSYHMVPNPLVEKYIFRDTDMAVDLRGESQDMIESFARLYDFKKMNSTIAEARAVAPNDVVANLKRAESTCKANGVSGKEALAACEQSAFESGFADLEQRLVEIHAQFTRAAAEYTSRYEQNPRVRRYSSGEVIPVDSAARLSYFENLPFDKKSPGARLYGADVMNDAASGKYIHALWNKALLQSCNDGVSVLLHNAYFFPPANLMATFADMTYAGLEKGAKVSDCSKTTLTIVTNSISTTDLNIVNIAARQSVRSVSVFYRGVNNPRKPAIDVLEYVKQDPRDLRSLHTKVSVYGNNLFVGSANLDVRSYMMDTNNGIYIEQAPGLAADYRATIQKLIRDGVVQSVAPAYRYDEATFKAQDSALVDQILQNYRVERWLDPAQIVNLKARILGLFDMIKRLTIESIERLPAELEPWNPDGGQENREYERQKKQNQFNERFQLI